MLFRHDNPSAAAVGSAAPGSLVVERPPPGLARGRYPASPFAIGLLGALLVFGTLLYFFLKLRNTRT